MGSGTLNRQRQQEHLHRRRDDQQRRPATPRSVGNLVAYYNFDGNLNDSSGNGNNGTANGPLTYAGGKSGQAVSFDGA